MLIHVKMDSLSQRDEHESSAKRLKLDLIETKSSVLCNESRFEDFSSLKETHSSGSEGISNDCDSGYDASTMESAPTPPNSQHITSPIAHTCDTIEDTHESLSEMADPELEDDNASTVSNLSDLSGLSDISGHEWKPLNGTLLWVQRQMSSGIDPRTLLSSLGTDPTKIPEYLDSVTLWKLIISMVAEPPRRHKLRHVNTLDDVVRLLKGAKNIIVLTGAGVSVSCGIPDFRSRDGIYSRLAVDFPDLPDPQAMFDIQYFSQDPRPFFKFAKDIYPGQFQPSPCHRFIKLLERHNKLLRNYSQNIDTLENVAGIERVIECHGSFASATCTRCAFKCDADAIKEAVMEQRIPMCPKCLEERGAVQSPSIDYKDMVSQGIMKPDIVFFGEGLPDHFHEAITLDKSRCDLLIVIGSSLKVRPVALIPCSIPENVPQILINREPLPECHFDVELLGDCDIIINQICHMMGSPWIEEGCWREEPLKETMQLLPPEITLPSTSSYERHANEETKSHITDEVKMKTFSVSFTSSAQVSAIISSENVTPDHNKLESQLLNISYNNTCDKKECESVNLSIDLMNSTDQVDRTVNIETIIPDFPTGDLKPKTALTERHISVDSAQDSGIGETSSASNTVSSTPKDEENYDASHIGMGNFWEPKLKRSLESRLPENTYYLVPPSRYIFPGAEVYYDPDENYTFSDGSSDSESSESECDSDHAMAKVSSSPAYESDLNN